VPEEDADAAIAASARMKPMNPAIEPEQLRDWIGRSESATDAITAWPAAALAATLDWREPPPQSGDELPPCWHWLYFLEAKPPGELGPDGHPKRGGFLPPVPLPRRMWAGGRLEFLQPLRIGEAIRRDSTILSVEPKHGRSGNLVFVTVQHTISNDAGIAVREEHDIVYREAAKAGDAPPATSQGAPNPPWQRSVAGDAVTLFRYSALTFNGHRIHYDLEYARHEEHYPGLVVHGPLQTTLMLDLCRRHSGRRVTTLDYRARLPLFHGGNFSVNGSPHAGGATAELWTANADGQITMSGAAGFAP
jgi:3-methylfumaryl-CoA hydratase